MNEYVSQLEQLKWVSEISAKNVPYASASGARGSAARGGAKVMAFKFKLNLFLSVKILKDMLLAKVT